MPTARLLNGRPLVEFIGGRKRELQRDFGVDLGVRLEALHEWDPKERWIVPSESGTTTIWAPKGTVYNGASIPWLALPIMGAREKYEAASVGHDLLYDRQAPRRAADEAFWIIARSGDEHVGPVRGWLGWAGLRLGGWWAYWRNGD